MINLDIAGRAEVDDDRGVDPPLDRPDLKAAQAGLALTIQGVQRWRGRWCQRRHIVPDAQDP